MEPSRRNSLSASEPQTVKWHPAPQQAGDPMGTPPQQALPGEPRALPTQQLAPQRVSKPPQQVPAGPTRLQRSLGVLRQPLQWVKAMFGPDPREQKFSAALDQGKVIIADYLGYGDEGDRAQWHQAALTGRVSRSHAPEVQLNAPLRLPRGVSFPQDFSDPRLRSDLGQQVFLDKDLDNGHATGRSLGWGQEPPPRTSWNKPVGGTDRYRPVEVAVVVRQPGTSTVKPDTKHTHAWDDGETVEYRLGGRGEDPSISPSEGVGRKLKPVWLTQAQVMEGVARHRSVLVRLSPSSAPAMVVLQACARDGQWIVRRPTSDSERAITGQLWAKLALPQDIELMFNPYDNVDRAEHPQRWHGAAPGDTLYVEGYPVTCRAVRKSDPEIPRADLLDVYCDDAQGDDAHQRLALRQKACGASVPAGLAEDCDPATGGRSYTIAIPATV
jgi:hypothetical protein